MTISINSSWCGNTPAHEFETVEDAVNHIKQNPSYEYLQDKRVRPYGDIDHYVGDDMDCYEFDILNTCVWMALDKYFKSIDRKVSLYTASSFNAKKISWRWVVPDVYVDSYKHAKEFAKTLYEQIDDLKQLEIKPDFSVYSANKKMRMVGTSKPNENRPLVCDNCDVEDTIITYIPNDAEHIPLELPEQPVFSAPVECKVDDELMKALLDCIGPNSWKSYEICRNLVWAMCSSGVSHEAIHAYCATASNYDYKWVANLIRSHNPSCSPQVSYIRKYAKLDSPHKYAELIFKNTSLAIEGHIDELLTLTTDSTTVYDTGRYMANITEDPTLAIKGMMGLGKTTAMKKHIKKHPNARILVLSGRRTFSDAIYADLKDDGFIHYEKHKEEHGRKVEIGCNKLILQLSPASFMLIKDQSYDIILIDESETVLTMLSPLNIYKSTADYVNMYTTFERIVTNAKQVICMDAFLTDRTMNTLHALRGKSKLVINETNPYDKTYIEVKGEQEFYRTLKKRIIGDKKRIVSVWGTVKAGEMFHKDLEHNGIKTVFYHKKSNEKVKAEHMSDVNTHWANHQSVGHTGTITVGLSYDNKEAEFDQLSLYASAWGCGARDYAQALHRARKIKDNEVIVHISPRAKPCSSEAGFTSQVDMWDRELNRTKQCLDDLGESYADYTTLPEWLKHLILWNRNERVMNSRHFPELMRAYLKMCGISNKEVVESEEKEERGKRDFIAIEDVRIICDEEAEYLNRNRKCMTEEDHFALERYYLSNRVCKIDQFIWEQWLKNSSVVENAYLMVHSDANELLHRQDIKVIELVSKNIPRLKLMKSLLFDWTQSWEMPVADVPEIDLSAFSLRKRTEKDTHEQHCREIAKSIKNWCGYAISVKQKRIKKGGVCSYEYSMVYNFEHSVAGYIEPKYTFEE